MNNYHKGNYHELPYFTMKCRYDFERNEYPLWINWSIRSEGCALPLNYHNHEDIELILMTEGAIMFEVEGDTTLLEPGGIMIANPLEFHSARFLDECKVSEYICLMFDFSLFSGLGDRINNALGELRRGKLAFRHYSRSERLADAIKSLFDRYQTGESGVGDLFGTSTGLCHLMECLFNEVGTISRTSALHDAEFIRRVVDYIDMNFAEPISTERIASELGYNKSYFCTNFKRNFGDNFLHYLCDYRINVAAERIAGGARSLTEVAASVGFSDYCYFSRCFRRVKGVPPNELRKQK